MKPEEYVNKNNITVSEKNEDLKSHPGIKMIPFTWRFICLYVGLDVHKKTIYITVMDETGDIKLQKEFQNNQLTRKLLAEKFKGLNAKFVLESSTAHIPVYRELEAAGLDVVVANTCQLKLISHAKIKTDKLDSERLATLLRADLIPEVYVPSEKYRNIRSLIKQRDTHVQTRSKYKNKIRAILTKEGLDCEYGDVSGKKARNWILENITDSTQKDMVKQNLIMIDCLTNQIKELEAKYKEIGSKSETVKLLKTIPGIGDYSAVLIESQICEINRFKDIKAFANYAGLVPSTKASGSVSYHGHIIKQSNKSLRHRFIQCAWTAIRYSPQLKKKYESLEKTKNKSIAIVGAAHKLAKITYSVLKNQKPYEERL